jgi:hypothetical protein
MTRRYVDAAIATATRLGRLPVTQAAFDECLCAEVTDAFGLIGDVVGA